MRGVNLLVFRGDQRRVCGHTLKAALVEQLQLLCADNSRERLIGALLRAGELECGLADARAEGARSAELLTDRIADALLQAEHGCQTPEGQSSRFASANLQNIPIQTLLDAARDLPEIEQISIATPEGFACYALHPLAYADVLDQICGPSGHLLVVGIRSIGTTLSAVMAAAARQRGTKAKRLTVRPQGHPYNRTAGFSARQLPAIKQYASCGATFAVADEGPGLSGSSFLAVAEALEQAGAPREKIVLVSSHAPNVDALCAADAARRWRRFRCVAVTGETRRPAEAADFIGGGQWRSRALANQQEWPASWTNFERLKYLSWNPSEDGEQRLYKFVGLGHYGDEVFERELKVAAAGFGPLPRRESDGFVSCPWISYQKTSGRSLSARNISPEVLARMAQYCAFRRRGFPAELADLSALQQMAEHNLHELGLDLPVELRLEHPVIADGRMQPHEWLVTQEGRLLKTDSGSHGDDHFFPGPTDIAWDLGGAIVEWSMNEQQAKDFIEFYRNASGDDASVRIDGFIKAYAVFRSAYCLMAANAISGSDEEPRLQRAAAQYKEMLTRIESRSLPAA